MGEPAHVDDLLVLLGGINGHWHVVIRGDNLDTVCQIINLSAEEVGVRIPLENPH